MEKKEMSFWDHLDELRSRFVVCLYIFFAGFFACYLLSDKLLDFLRRPLFKYLPEQSRHLYYTGLFENFFVHLRVAGYGSLVLLSPVYFLVLWRFVAPALYERERRQVFPFVVAGSLFFMIGAALAYFVLFPAGVRFFLAYGTPAEVAWLTLESYISLVLKILFGFGVCFQLPVVLVLLAKVGVVTHSMLVAHRKTALVVVAVISALVAPPDAISMLLLMAPLYLLFEGALAVVSLMQKRKNTTKY